MAALRARGLAVSGHKVGPDYIDPGYHALARGFAGFDPRTPVAGVILNRVASDRHERLLRDALAPAGLPVYGAIRRAEDIVTPSRHLGLIPAAERDATARQAIARMGDLI